MAETTKIEWADSTVSIWEGCQETGSPACVGCYARERNLRYAPKGSTVAPNWGPHAPRREVKSWRSTLRKISRLALAAFAAGRTEPWFVFVNSLSDFWDNQADPALRHAALDEFAKHPHLTFLLLTKRPQNIVKMVKAMVDSRLGPYADDQGVRGWWPRNVAIGCTVVTQAEADRDVPHLLAAKVALRPAFAFLSMEPLAETVDLEAIKVGHWTMNALTGKPMPTDVPTHPVDMRSAPPFSAAVDWVITGGGTDQGKHKAYPTPAGAFEIIRDQCEAASVAYLHKQNGEWAHLSEVSDRGAIRKTARFDRGTGKTRVGKKAAGRLLGGRTHDARPEVRQ